MSSWSFGFTLYDVGDLFYVLVFVGGIVGPLISRWW